MKIPTPLSAIRALDHEVHYLFMKAGMDKIPEKTRAAWSYSLGLGGASLLAGGVGLHFIPSVLAVVPNGLHCRRVMGGRVSTATNDTLDYSTLKIKAWNRKIRPLYLILGGYIACRIGYDVLDATFTDSVLDVLSTFSKTLIGGGGALVATAMYLSDVDPKVLDKSSKLQDAYDTVTGKELEPVPVHNYQTLEATL